MISYANCLQFDGAPEAGRVVVEAFGASDVADARRTNDHHFLVADMEKSVLVTESNVPADNVPPFADVHSQMFLVADGMRGNRGSQRASRRAAELMLRHAASRVPEQLPAEGIRAVDVEDQVRAAMDHCEAEIGRIGFATSLTVAHLLWPKLCVGHVGSSRCYLLRKSQLTQLTTPEWRGSLLAKRGGAIGLRPQGARRATPQVFTLELRPDDALLLCTDDLAASVPDDEIREAMLAARSPEAACEQLVQAAREGGADDSVTVVVVRVPLAMPLPRDRKRLTSRRPTSPAAPVLSEYSAELESRLCDTERGALLAPNQNSSAEERQ